MNKAEAECSICGETFAGPVLIVLGKIRDHIDTVHPDVNGILFGPR